MLLTVFNGCPCGKYGSTAVLTDQFLKGFTDAGSNAYQLIYLSPDQVTETQLRFFGEAEVILIAFPVYTACMPSRILTFIEALEHNVVTRGRPRMGFLVYATLPEALHTRPLERYLEKLTKRLAFKYLGTVIKGGVSGQGRPARMSRSLRHAFYLLGKHFGVTGQFDPELLSRIAQPERLTPFWVKSMTVLTRTGLANYYWDRQMLENEALETRFAQPFKSPGL